MLTNKSILEALSQVDDPDLKKDLVTLGMIQNLTINELQVSFDLVLTTPACPMKDMLVKACTNAIKFMVDENAVVLINVTHNQKPNVNPEINGVQNIIGIASGKGGVGKSTIAAGLAMALSKKGAKVGLLDADIYGPSIPTLFNIHEPPNTKTENDKDIIIPHLRYGIKILSIGFMTQPGQAIVWRGPMVSSAFKQFTRDTDWSNLDYLIIDLPPGTGDIQISMSQLQTLTGVVIVSTPQTMSTVDAQRAIDMFKQPAINKTILGVVQNMSYFQDPNSDIKHYIFGENGAVELANKHNLPILAQLPLNPNIQQLADSGDIDNPQFYSHFSEMADNIVRQASIANSKK